MANSEHRESVIYIIDEIKVPRYDNPSIKKTFLLCAKMLKNERDGSVKLMGHMIIEATPPFRYAELAGPGYPTPTPR